MKIEVLGPGCAKCKKLFANAKQAVEELGVQIDVTKVEDIQEIMNYGIMMTPGLVIDGKVVSTGKLLRVNDVKTHIEKSRSATESQ
jgi:small redox-active disulfide protein 2